MSKGSRDRTRDRKSYESNYDAIFGKKNKKKTVRKQRKDKDLLGDNVSH